MQRLNRDVNEWMAPLRAFGDTLKQAYHGGDMPLLVKLSALCVAVKDAQRLIEVKARHRNTHRVGNTKRPNLYVRIKSD